MTSEGSKVQAQQKALEPAAGDPPQKPHGHKETATAAVASPKHVTRADKERARQLAKPVTLGFLSIHLANNLQNRKLMSGLAFYVMFVILFVFYFLARRDMEAEYFMTNSMRNLVFHKELPPTNPVTPTELFTLPYFHKGFDEIGNYGDIYDFVEGVLISQLFVDPPANTPDRRIGGQNIPIGSLRIRVKHVSNTSCSVNGRFYPKNRSAYERLCYGRYSSSHEKKDPLGDNGYSWNWTDGCQGWPLLRIIGIYATYDCSSFNVDIPFTTSLQDALAIVSTFRQGNFFNVVSLRLFSWEWYTYNPAIDAFVSSKLFCEVTPEGGFLPQGRFRAFRVQNEKDRGWAFYYIFFAAIVTGYVIRFALDWIRHARLTQRRFAFLFDLWNLLELINLASFYTTFGFVFYWWHISVQIEWKFPRNDESFPLDIASVGEAFLWGTYFNAINTVIVFLKILKYLRLNSRLNILQRTIERAAQGIVGVLVVFCLVVLSYALCGYTLYGTGLFEYRRVDEAFAQLFRSLIGQFDYDAMRQFNRGLTFVYFWSFTILGLFVCLNFIIAVIMTGFDEENDRIKSVPLHVAIRQWFRSIKQFLLTPGVAGRVVAATLSSANKMPERELHDALSTYMSTLRMAREELDEAEAEEEGPLEDMLFYRHDWDKVMPRIQLEEIGEDYLNNVWCETVADFELLNPDEEEQHRAEIVKNVFVAVAEASTRILIRHKKRLFGEADPVDATRRLSAAAHRVGASAAALESTFAVLTASTNRRESLLGRRESVISSVHTEGDEAEQLMEASVLNALQRPKLKTASGADARSTADIIEDLDQRIQKIERRYACMAQLMSTIAEKIG